MRFIYNFDGYDFPFEIDGSELMDAKYYIKQTHTNDEILKDYLEYLYPNESEYNKESVEDYGFYGTEESIKDMSEKDKDELVNEVIYDLIDLDVYNEELEDYFEDEAYEDFSSDYEAELNTEYNRNRL